MSEFTCCNGEIMVRDKQTGELTCPVCGGTKAKYMDGMSNAGIKGRDRYEEEHPGNEDDD